MKMKIQYFDELDSTQSELIRQIRDGKYNEGTIILANNQLNGYGRCNTTWITVEGCLVFSIGYKRNISIMSAVNNIIYALNKFNIIAQYKWPNDILLKGRKICGIIIERIKPWNIIGIGINLANINNYDSIEKLTGIKLDKIEFINQINFTNVHHNHNMDNVWFNEEFCPVKEITGEYLIIEYKRKDIFISALKYSYKIELNRVIKKVIN
jgi:biotin-[acetyl-CoA-carboxylase] ligase BirA-like protein